LAGPDGLCAAAVGSAGLDPGFDAVLAEQIAEPGDLEAQPPVLVGSTVASAPRTSLSPAPSLVSTCAAVSSAAWNRASRMCSVPM
jgi:hypothetical protein